YYELGPDNPSYAAKFYDFCGAEDPEASSCTTSFHVSMMTIDPYNVTIQTPECFVIKPREGSDYSSFASQDDTPIGAMLGCLGLGGDVDLWKR
ncbi:hypothetical protein DVH24_013843, partial [Malus domestica]